MGILMKLVTQMEQDYKEAETGNKLNPNAIIVSEKEMLPSL